MKAVDSEFNMSLQNDFFRQFMLKQTLSDLDGALNRFCCGNLESLQQEGVRECLLNFHKTWYSANIMKLTVSGKHSLDQLEKWATEMFSDVKNMDVKLPDFGSPVMPFSEANLGKIQRFRPVLDKDELLIYWVLPYCQSEFKSQPLQYLSHLFGHEG